MIPSYFVELDDFNELSFCGRSIRRLLKLVGCDSMLSIEEKM